ncbi:MAG: CIA30 family protein [Cyclobacteriaceae bacterium]
MSHTWYALTDRVMGGRSQGAVSFEADVLRFSGTVSFDNNGGFSSVRGDHAPLDLSEYSTVTVRYRVQHQSLTLNFNHYNEWYRPNYKAVLPETGMDWKTVTLPLSELEEYSVGSPTGNKIDQSKLKRIIRLGIMTADKKEGSFNAEVDFIRFD